MPKISKALENLRRNLAHFFLIENRLLFVCEVHARERNDASFL